jgi:hypothetical protein
MIIIQETRGEERVGLESDPQVEIQLPIFTEGTDLLSPVSKSKQKSIPNPRV